MIVPPEARTGPHEGLATIHVEGMRTVAIPFAVRVTDQQPRVDYHQEEGRAIRKAFASYASQDEAAVLARIQGMQKALPNLDVFHDRSCLRSGTVYIDPVPLVDPRSVSPPPELCTKHFNDWVLAFTAAQDHERRRDTL